MPRGLPPFKLNILNYPYDSTSLLSCQYISSIFLTF
nr:MAG TPA: hypothetical protein [Caudoviricetes sp.]DAZ40835.1 MAG TPA: hypothetical protein [Caudoviricetes sp.]